MSWASFCNYIQDLKKLWMNNTESTGVYGGRDCARQWITMECESLWEMTNGPEGKLVWIRAEIF